MSLILKDVMAELSLPQSYYNPDNLENAMEGILSLVKNVDESKSLNMLYCVIFEGHFNSLIEYPPFESIKPEVYDRLKRKIEENN